MKQYTAAIIGYGGMAGHHEKVMRVDYDRMKLKGIFDLDQRRCDVAKEQGYLKQMMSFQSENPDTAEIFEDLRKDLNDYLEERS